MQETLGADRADLSLSEETSQWHVAQLGLDLQRIMVGGFEHPGASSVAGEQQGTGDVSLFGTLREHQLQVLARGCRVPDMELDCLPNPYVLRDRNRAVVLIDAHDVSDEKITSGELLLVFVDHAADVERSTCKLLLFFFQLEKDLLELLERWLAAQLLDHVVLALGHNEMATDRTASLADDGADLDRAPEQHTDHPVLVSLVIQEETILTRTLPSAGYSTDHGRARILLFEFLQNHLGH